MIFILNNIENNYIIYLYKWTSDAQIAEQKPEKKTADKRRYCANTSKSICWKSREIKELNRMYYAKYKYNISEEECKKYGANLPNVIKTKNEFRPNQRYW